MLSDDLAADRLRPNVCKIVLAIDAADLQPVRFDFILQRQMRQVDVFHFVSFSRFHVDEECVLLLLRQ